MIYYVATERFSSTTRRFLSRYASELHDVVRLLTYEELFLERAAPIGHYIFTDFDSLSRYELEEACAAAEALRKAAPEIRILNHPLRALRRFPLLRALHGSGLNDFTAIRIDEGARPPAYPVFIRAEDGHGGPETDLIHSDAEFDAAVAGLTTRGLPQRGRIAVGFANEPDEDGFFQKYGAFNIGGRLIPHDRMSGRTWVVQMRFEEGDRATSRDAADGHSEPGGAAELRTIKDDSHRDALRKAFDIAGIDYGRAEYGVVRGRVQIFGINTNPDLPVRADADPGAARQAIVQANILAGLKALDTPIASRGVIHFDGRPRAYHLHLPRRRIFRSVSRMVLRAARIR